MRAIFLTLVVANLVALGVLWWQSGTAEPPAAAAANRPASTAAPLQLLSELQGERSAQIPVSERQRVVDEPVAPGRTTTEAASGTAPADRGEPLCTLVGPFSKHLPAEYFVEHLQALEVAASVVVLEVPGKPNYWVYQKPEASRKAALRRLHELQAKGIDSFVIPKGDLENGISFGVFSEIKRAEARAVEIRALGYAAEVRPRPRTFEEIWVSLGSGEAAKIGRESWLELLNRESGLEKRENFCPAVASW